MIWETFILHRKKSTRFTGIANSNYNSPEENCEANFPIVLHAPPYGEAFEYFMLDNLLHDLVRVWAYKISGPTAPLCDSTRRMQ